MRPIAAITCIATAVAMLPGCGADSSAGSDRSSSPEEAVAAAARLTLATDTSALSVAAESRDSNWEAAGLIDLADGRFRVETEVIPYAHPARITVVGLGGEGYENTVEETAGAPFAGSLRGRVCWFNPHAPVGFYADPISVEESVRLTGAIVESLPAEIARAKATGPGSYEVQLEPTAAQPRDDFRDRPERIWGDRILIDELRGPITIGLSDTRIDSIGYELDHKPSYRFRERPYELRRVRIEAALEPADAPLVIKDPGCGGLE